MNNYSNENRRKPAYRWLWIGVSLALLVAVVVLLFGTEDTIDVHVSKSPPPPPVVSVITAKQQEVEAQISAFAEVRPRWDAELRSAVSGRIVKVHDAALAGSEVKRGELLFSIEDAPYQSAVAASKMELEEAELALLRAQNNVTVARRQFERDGASPPNDLALNLPQLRIAERSVATAKARLNAAQSELAETNVIAPFSGFVTLRLASLGQTVSPGEALLHLSDNRHFELVAEYSQSDWVLLDHPISGTTADLFDRSGGHLGQALVRHGGGFLDKNTRQVRVFLDVTAPDERILAGDFLKVRLPGRTIENALTLPESTVTRTGHIWLVGEDDHLQRISPNIIFRDEGLVTISAPEEPGLWRIAKTPLASFLPGQRVTPLPDEG